VLGRGFRVDARIYGGVRVCCICEEKQLCEVRTIWDSILDAI
jgi:hypothetical protein